MRNNREGNRDNRNMEPRWAHGHHHGENSDRGNYTVDSHFNSGYGEQEDDYYDTRTFNTNIDHEYGSRQGRFQPGGAQYSGEDFTSRNRRGQDNPYGMSYVPNDDYNSGRHYDPQADYSDRDYDDMRRQGNSWMRTGMPDERFGHDVGRGDRDFRGHSSMGDYESYRRYEMGNRQYDNDYSGGFAGRNHTEGRDHFGEDSYYSNMDRWGQNDRQRRSEDRHNRH
ncbi:MULTISPECIES: hypothetical protein [Pontibacter]|uniref:Uncharacterized protein n=1 Tax=Pontibacter lucknowensis TaxID=1077936 RepID=A0A1N6WFR9_9BACT|nr:MULTISPECIES: hypothetical protein [Pontibacter]EJF11552.1 hypothetical protein O71_02427 [Pontibacter sp. BAB1700]SIQ88989.1 hypothetical protein SAMN05421545_1516 [Pontibacter lucknowensis]